MVGFDAAIAVPVQIRLRRGLPSIGRGLVVGQNTAATTRDAQPTRGMIRRTSLRTLAPARGLLAVSARARDLRSGACAFEIT